jgi:PTS system nitrogen regulatory IIA component
MHFGATLRVLRTNAGWTLRELAERLGVSNTYLSRVENGHDGPPTPDRLAELAALLGLPPGKLIELADGVVPTAPNYLARVPAARDLFLEIVRRELSPLDLARVRAFVEREFPVAASRSEQRALHQMLSAARVVLKVACTHIDDVIDVAVTKLASPTLRAARLGDAIRSRERDCSSVIGGGLALPHAIVPGAPPAAVVVTLRSPLFVASPDGKPVRLVLVHVHPGPPAHTRLLADLARLAESAKVEAVCAESRASDVVRVLGALLAS